MICLLLSSQIKATFIFEGQRFGWPCLKKALNGEEKREDYLGKRSFFTYPSQQQKKGKFRGD